MGCENVPVFRFAEEPLIHKYKPVDGSYFHGKD